MGKRKREEREKEGNRERERESCDLIAFSPLLCRHLT